MRFQQFLRTRVWFSRETLGLGILAQAARNNPHCWPGFVGLQTAKENSVNMTGSLSASRYLREPADVGAGKVDDLPD